MPGAGRSTRISRFSAICSRRRRLGDLIFAAAVPISRTSHLWRFKNGVHCRTTRRGTQPDGWSISSVRKNGNVAPSSRAKARSSRGTNRYRTDGNLHSSLNFRRQPVMGAGKSTATCEWRFHKACWPLHDNRFRQSAWNCSQMHVRCSPIRMQTIRLRIRVVRETPQRSKRRAWFTVLWPMPVRSAWIFCARTCAWARRSRDRRAAQPIRRARYRRTCLPLGISWRMRTTHLRSKWWGFAKNCADCLFPANRLRSRCRRNCCDGTSTACSAPRRSRALCWPANGRRSTVISWGKVTEPG